MKTIVYLSDGSIEAHANADAIVSRGDARSRANFHFRSATSKNTTMARYSGDPYWTVAKFAGLSANKDRTPIKRGDRIFYYPNGRQSFVGAEAEAASRDFESCAQDEAFMSGETY